MSDRDRGGCVTGNRNVDSVMASPQQRSIWFIRHGESRSNAGLATCDPVLIDLTDTGHKQARSVAKVCREAPSMIIVSRYQRTRQTAFPTLRKFAMKPEVWDVHEFTYLGQLHGQMTTKQQRSRYVDAYWSEPKPRYVSGDGAESFVEFFLRTQHVVKRLLGMRERFIMVFSHEQFITAARWVLSSERTFGRADINVDMMSSFRHALATSPLPNGAILPVSIEDGKPQCGTIVTSHLG